jgi:hypothetical protein
MKWFYQNVMRVLLVLNHIFNDSNLIFISFLKSLSLKIINIILVPSVNKTGLEFIFMVTDNHSCRENKIKKS